MHLGLIKTLFADAPIVHTIRSPLDTILSVYFLQFGEGASYSLDLIDTTFYYIAYRRLIEHWRTLYGNDIIDLRYEHLVTDPVGEIARVAARLGVGVQSPRESETATQSSIRTPSAWQVRRPVHTGSIGRWRHYDSHLVEVRRLLEEAGLDPEW